MYITWWLIPLLVSGLVHPSYKWINPSYISHVNHWGYNPLTKWVVRHQVIIMYFFITHKITTARPLRPPRPRFMHGSMFYQ